MWFPSRPVPLRGRGLRVAVGLPIVAALAALPLACRLLGQAPEAAGPATPSPAEEAPKLLDGLGGHQHRITTSSELAQRYFDQGLILAYGFNHEAAVRSFEHAASLDPTCGMCFWGIALALGPNINAPMGPEAGKRAYAAAQQARARRGDVSPREAAYIDAIAVRYAADPPADRAHLDRAYAEAMREVHRAYPDDIDAAVLLAEALMDLYPWDYWTDEAEPREHTAEILALLEAAQARDPRHVGANHYYIHAVEEFFPEKAVAAADRLGPVAPEAGHLVHMPSHIYWRVGRYADALEINQRAAAADEQYFAWCRPGAFYRAAYYPHNVHFLWAAASAEGRRDLAISTARKLQAVTREQLDAFPFLEEFQSIPILTLARFGQWDRVLGEPKPDPAHVYLTGIWHYARGLARVRTGDRVEAAAELAALRAVAASDEARALILAGGTAPASQLLGIGEAHLAGELEAARGNTAGAVEALRRAVARQDELVYMEPPPWYFPTRQALGAVLLEAGRAAEAEAVYRRDLEAYPGQGWSLYGLAASLRAQGKGDEAAYAERGFQQAWARADVELRASRF